jgi:hypothetical protein
VKGAAPDEGLYARLDGSSEVAKVAGGALTDLEPGLAALRAKPPSPAAAEAKAAPTGTK